MEQAAHSSERRRPPQEQMVLHAHRLFGDRVWIDFSNQSHLKKGKDTSLKWVRLLRPPVDFPISGEGEGKKMSHSLDREAPCFFYDAPVFPFTKPEREIVYYNPVVSLCFKCYNVVQGILAGNNT